MSDVVCQLLEGQEGKGQSDSHWGPYPDFWAISTISKHKLPTFGYLQRRQLRTSLFFFKLRVISGGHPGRTVPMVRAPTRLHPLPTVTMRSWGWVGGGCEKPRDTGPRKLRCVGNDQF